MVTERNLLTITVTMCVDADEWVRAFGPMSAEDVATDARDTLTDAIADAINPFGGSVLYPANA